MQIRSMIALATILCSACGGGEPATAPQTTVSVDPALVGIWHVRKANGQELPYVLSQTSSSKTQLDDGTLTTRLDGTFVQQLNWVTTSSGVIKIGLETDLGTFSTADSITFHFVKAGNTSRATLSHDTLTVLDGALTLALTR